jgi:hypothetical protein
MIVAFRADEKANEGREEVMLRFVRSYLPQQVRESSGAKLLELIDQYGPVVTAYPHWHPLIITQNQSQRFCPETIPNAECGYDGLDHTIYLRDAFITCPYERVDDLLRSVEKRKSHPVADITAEILEFPLYAPKATPVLVKCQWNYPLESGDLGYIPKSIAVPLLLERQLPHWRNEDKAAETWGTMRSYFLGTPCGSRSSLFVNQETGQALKNLWNTLIQTGMFGPIMPR